MEQELLDLVVKRYGKELRDCAPEEICAALLEITSRRLAGVPLNAGQKKLYYISAEFLVGKLLGCTLMALGEYDAVAALLERSGHTMGEVEEAEPEPSLGNGGLGRLAACFLDSIATLGLPGSGVGLRYHLGLFRQVFRDRRQTEEPDPWLSPESWLIPREVSFQVPMGNGVLTSRLYDLPVAGYGGGKVFLHLFDLDTVEESLVKEGISFDQTDIPRNLTLFLYPDDSTHQGKLLRLCQQYFMVSSAAQLILREAREAGSNLRDLGDYAVIQINDTHPSLVIPELIRLLTLEGLEMEEAAKITASVCAYTNHTILAEALEKWPLADLEAVAPQLTPILQWLDAQVKKRHPGREELGIIDEDGLVHMARLDIHYGFSVNGVAALHTRILEESELRPFYQIYPEKFSNKTNGITFRRWLLHCNRPLTRLLEETIGPGFRKDAGQLEKLLEFRSDPQVLDRLLGVKAAAKEELGRFLLGNTGQEVDPASLFDIQSKRLHQYKRQQMNALWIIHQYREILRGHTPPRPVTAVFGAKAAPAYTQAKDIIHLLLCLSALCAADPAVAPWLRVVMVENYNVAAAEKMIPACDLSEQISLASKEASGTGNMKFMLNGAVTLGTLDGANVEISQLVGPGNIYLFGAASQEVLRRYEEGSYRPGELLEDRPPLRELVEFITSPQLLELGDRQCLERLRRDFEEKDWFMALPDLPEYIRVKEEALEDSLRSREWAEKMLVNIAKAGFFSADRTIREYNQDIWRLADQGPYPGP